MTRVSERSSTNALQYAISKARKRMEDLQIKGTSLTRMTRPSDDPMANIDVLQINSQNVDITQYKRNSTYAKTALELTESALEDLAEVMNKAKEIAIGQASDIYNDDVRKSVSKEVEQLRNQAIAIANRRIGSRYLFGGYKNNAPPFSNKGEYLGDDGKMFMEISKDFFIPTNLTGQEIFFDNPDAIKKGSPELRSDELTEEMLGKKAEQARDIASQNGAPKVKVEESVFHVLEMLENALNTADADVIQALLPQLDKHANRMITMRTRLGSLTNSIANAEESQEKVQMVNNRRKSTMQDADVIELFSDITKQKDILKATYQTGNSTINTNLLDFIR